MNEYTAKNADLLALLRMMSYVKGELEKKSLQKEAILISMAMESMESRGISVEDNR